MLAHGCTSTSSKITSKAVCGNSYIHHRLLKAKLVKFGKVMFTIFFTSQRILLNRVVPADSNVNGEYYAYFIQTDLSTNIRRKQPDLVRRGYALVVGKP